MRTKLSDDEISMVLSDTDYRLYGPLESRGCEWGAHPDFQVAEAFGMGSLIDDFCDRVTDFGSSSREPCWTIDELAVALEVGISIPRRVLEDGDLSAYEMYLLA